MSGDVQTVDTSGVANKLANGGSGRGLSIFAQIEAQKPGLEKLGVDPVRFARVVVTEVRKSKQLQNCTPASLLGAMMAAAQLGIEFGPLGRGYLSSYGREATFILGYRGIIELTRRSGTIRQLEAREVRDNDEFDFDLGLEPYLHHKWDHRKPRGDVVSYYGLATFTDRPPFILPVSLDEIEDRRRRSPSGRNDKGPWHTDKVAMSRKTVVRMMEPWLPLETRIAEAIKNDERVRHFDETAADPDEALTLVDWPDESEAGGAGGDEPAGTETGTPVGDRGDTPPASDDELIFDAELVETEAPGPAPQAAEDGEEATPTNGVASEPVTFDYGSWSKDRLVAEARARNEQGARIPTSKTMLEIVAALAADDAFTGRTHLETS